MNHETKARDFLLRHVLGKSMNDAMVAELADLLAEAEAAERQACAMLARRLAEEAVGAERRRGFDASTATSALHRFQCEGIADAILAQGEA